MKHIWTVLCQNSVIDQQTNNLSIHNCIEALSLSLDERYQKEAMVTIPVEFQMVSYWKREQDEVGDLQGDLRMDVLDPRKIVLSSYATAFIMKSEFNKTRNRWTIQGLQISATGDYTLLVYKKTPSGEYGLIAELPLEVNIEYK